MITDTVPLHLYKWLMKYILCFVVMHIRFNPDSELDNIGSLPSTLMANYSCFSICSSEFSVLGRLNIRNITVSIA